jgi:hypothetical protein
LRSARCDRPAFPSRVVVRAGGAVAAACVDGAGVDGAGSDGVDVDDSGAARVVPGSSGTVGVGGGDGASLSLLALGGASGWGAETLGAGSGPWAATAAGASVKPNATAPIETHLLRVTPYIEIRCGLCPLRRTVDVFAASGQPGPPALSD